MTTTLKRTGYAVLAALIGAGTHAGRAQTPTPPVARADRGNIQAPLHLLPVVETGRAWVWRADFPLVPGEVIHDYLANPFL